MNKNLKRAAVVTALTVPLVTVAGPAMAGRTWAAETCVPKAAWTETAPEHTETTGWLLESPGPEWSLWEDQKVIEVAYEPSVQIGWQRYSWTGGPHESDDAPAFPSDDWQPNVKGDPHKIGHAGAYFRSHGNHGNGDWFYLEAVMSPEVQEVFHMEYRYNRIVAGTTIEHPAVVCPTPDPTVTPTPEPTVKPKPVKVTKEQSVKVVKKTPTTEALPHTGASDVILALFGVALVAGGTTLVLRSLRK